MERLIAVKTCGTIALVELAIRADVHPRTIQRREAELELTRLRSSGRKVVYQFSGTVDALLSRIMAAYRRGGGMRLSHVPDPAFVRQKITSAFGPQPEMIMSGCLLTLAKLATAALILGYDAGVQINAHRHQRLVGSRHHGKIIDILFDALILHLSYQRGDASVCTARLQAEKAGRKLHRSCHPTDATIPGGNLRSRLPGGVEAWCRCHGSRQTI